MTRTALYVRFSSARQVGGASLPDQLARLRADCLASGETISGEYIDQARSGASAAKRPAYQQLLAAARQGEFDRVRVESVDRGHRNDTERRAGGGARAPPPKRPRASPVGARTGDAAYQRGVLG
jgi:DNA invertase Pin-like site-specific DNA recombinase